MELSSRKRSEACNSFLLVYIEVIVLLSCFNFQGLNLLGLASPVLRGNDTDQQALLQFKAKITGDQLRVMESWNSSIHFCQWHGVKCGRKHQRVVKLELQYLKLAGSLSSYIGNLSFLRELSLVGNNFYYRIPQEIGRLRRLETLKLTNNSISGEIPSNISACSKLALVDVRSNMLTGEIPPSLGLLSNLKIFSFPNNSLRGSIPPSLGNLSSLEKFSLAINELTGTIPEALGKLRNLSDFTVGANAISGTVPIAMFNLSNIRFFDIGYNSIQGTLRSDLEINMPYVEYFSVGGNRISGQIPVSLFNSSHLSLLQFEDNKLSGNVPSLDKLDKLYQFLLYQNNLGHGREGDLKFLCTLVNNSKLETLEIFENKFGGVLPECLSNFSTTLLHLAIDDNDISGRIPDGICNLINLEDLGASQNHLSGPIPLGIGRLRKLNMFSADSNFLSGTIPYSIGNLSMLTELALDGNNLHGNIPSSLGKCQNLVALDLSNNNLSGRIPLQVLGISSMSIALDLSSNYLTSELPAEVEQLKNLGELDVSKNRLSGLLPNNLGSCLSLEKLLLYGNMFEGHIPSSWSSLRGLVALDISHNNISGQVPEFLVTFRALKYLNLSFNEFEGVIPSGGVFKNASATFVEGNKKLCGGITELNLPRCNSKTSSNTFLSLKFPIVVVILGVALVLSFLLIKWFRKKKRQQQPSTSYVENSFLWLSYQSILRATNGFSVQNFVGSGSFGSVYKGTLEENGATVAVKVLNLLNPRASRSFLAECQSLKNIRHRNIVKLLTAISGVDYQGQDFRALVYEFMVNGSLEDWLHHSANPNELETMRKLNFLQRVNVAVDVAHALEYMHHHCETSVIHCDIKPSNILLDEEMTGHLSDFGLARIFSIGSPHYHANQSSSLVFRGTIGYAPPECGMGSELSTRSDVYSYGILLLEMFTKKRPTDESFKEGLTLHNFVKTSLSGRLIEIIDPIILQERVRRGSLNGNNMGNDKHLRCLKSIFEIGLACSVESPSERIDMSDVITKLCSIRDMLHRT